MRSIGFHIGRRCLHSTTLNRTQIEPWPSSGLPIEEASTPPASWYTSEDVMKIEENKVFTNNWIAVGTIHPLQNVGDYITGNILGTRYLICKSEDGDLRAFHNVCRHKAASVAEGQGCAKEFECPYHGWTYTLDGRLKKAPRLGGIKNFRARNNGLLPMAIDTLGPFIFILPNSDNLDRKESLRSWLGKDVDELQNRKILDDMRYISTRKYVLKANWKVVCDNYLDGGYHLPYIHKSLTDSLEMSEYKTDIFNKISIQSCLSADSDRIGENANYVFMYPNFMINRYGPWLDTNYVIPLSPEKTLVTFDYYLEKDNDLDEKSIKESIIESDRIQMEDAGVCESVQLGLKSVAYDTGRYAPRVESGIHEFHRLLDIDLK